MRSPEEQVCLTGGSELPQMQGASKLAHSKEFVDLVTLITVISVLIADNYR
jgi:hypothetical protein